MFGPRPWRLLLLASLAGNMVLLVRFLSDSSCHQEEYPRRERSVFRKVTDKDNSTISISSRQIVFVGGVPRSGTTLTRVMLDAHPEIRCGEETRVIPRIISMRSRWSKAEKEHQRLEAAGVNDDTLDQATRAFVSEIILNHGAPAKYLCNKDPLVLNYMYDIIRMFPKAKFVLMVRDGRAVAYSIVSRNVTISGVDSKSYMSAALFWNKVVDRMIRDCKSIKEKCLMVFYEKLVANPREWMGRILEFLHIPWHDNVLHHHELINSEVSLSKYVYVILFLLVVVVLEVPYTPPPRLLVSLVSGSVLVAFLLSRSALRLVSRVTMNFIHKCHVIMFRLTQSMASTFVTLPSSSPSIPPSHYPSLPPILPPLCYRMEPSSNQVKEAVHTNAVEKWREKLPAKVKKDIYKECEMLEELGYPP